MTPLPDAQVAALAQCLSGFDADGAPHYDTDEGTDYVSYDLVRSLATEVQRSRRRIADLETALARLRRQDYDY